jgi:mRNA-degrading endonuclease HigB of HigAB toxin-antitoxin module
MTLFGFARRRWTSTSDVKRFYANASIVTAERIVFNINGNSYRLVVSVDFQKGIVWIRWLGTHRDYDRIDVIEVERPLNGLSLRMQLIASKQDSGIFGRAGDFAATRDHALNSDLDCAPSLRRSSNWRSH